MRRNVSYSKAKLSKIETIGFWKLKLRQLKGEMVDVNLMNKKKERGSIEVPEQITVNEAKESLRKAKEDWSKWKKEGAKQREKELLDRYPKEIDEEQLSSKKRKKILKSIRKGMQ